ncbi:MAG: hypothetical protein L6265_07360 [Thermoplasmatales archaeon]|nr:hypothetical protein [Thermoplasmatales archaeon]
MKEKGTKNKTKKMKRKKRKEIYVLANQDGLDCYAEEKDEGFSGSGCAMAVQGSMTGVFFSAIITEQTYKKIKRILKKQQIKYGYGEGFADLGSPESRKALKVIKKEALKIRPIIPPGKSGKERLDDIITT